MMRRRSAAVSLAASGLVLGCFGTGGTVQTQASWADAEFATATVTAGQLKAVSSFTCDSASGLLPPIKFNWTPNITGTGVPPKSYTMTWSGAAGAGSNTGITGLSSSIGAGGLLSVSGKSTVTVRPVSGPWVPADSTPPLTITTSVSLLGIIIGWTCGP